VQYACFSEFPDQCVGCPEYTEVRVDKTLELSLLSGLGSFSPTQFMAKIVKECQRFHKRKVEYI